MPHIRQDIVTKVLARGIWPSDWRDVLAQRESLIFGAMYETPVKEVDRGEKRKRDASDSEILAIQGSSSSTNPQVTLGKGSLMYKVH